MAASATTTAPVITIERLPATAVPAELEARLLELALPGGEMAKVYRACRRGDAYEWTGQVIVARDGDEVLGWALRWKPSRDRSWWSLHLFVDPAHRRRGVGTELVAASRYRLRRHTGLRGFIWDDRSAGFWSTIDMPAVFAPDYRR